MSGKRFIIAGGGTGGHIFPAIAIANAIRQLEKDVNILFVGARGKMEMEKVPQAGYQIEGLTIAGFNRSSLIKNIHLPFKLIKSFIQVAKIFKRFMPDAVIGVGGYSSFPVLRFAQSKGIPTFIHESNSYAGKSNIMLSRKAVKIFTAAEGMERFFPLAHTIVTGNPVRKGIKDQQIAKDEGLNFFGLDHSKKTILSIGGSLGAKNINEAIAKGIGRFAEHNLQLIWQTGKPFYQQAMNIARGQSGVYVTDFITKMEYAYAAADIVISRSGAMAVSELCIVKKPVIFVPFPFAAEDHQTENAKRLVDKNAAIMIAEKEASDNLIETVINLSENEIRQIEMAGNISRLAILDADIKIAEEIISSLK